MVYVLKKIKEIIPNIIFELMSKKTCIAWPCTTCGGYALEKETLKQLNFFIEEENLEPNTEILQQVFIEAMCRIDMKSMTAFNETTDTSTAPFSGSYLPYWSVYLRNIAKNDVRKKSDRLTFLFDYKEIYTYWIKHRLNEIDLVDFMIFYNEFVPTNLKKQLFLAGQELARNNHPSLSETLKHKKGDFES